MLRRWSAVPASRLSLSSAGGLTFRGAKGRSASTAASIAGISVHRPFIIGLSAVTTSVIFYSLYSTKSSTGAIRCDGPSDPRKPSTTDKDYRPIQTGGEHFKKPQEESLFPDWNQISARIRNAMVPDWAQDFPDYVLKLQQELSADPGSLADEIWHEAQDPDVHPEIARQARVRVSKDLCDEEKHFLAQRKKHTAKALAKYLDLPESEINPDDVPVIAMCGSGGGLRALVAGTSSYYSAQRAGLFDCVTYTAGVSGSCWLQLLYYSSISGQRHDRLLDHLKARLGVHIAFPPPVLKMLTTAPTNKFLLAGGYEKYRGEKDADFGLVDVYGLLLGARLLVPRGEVGVDGENLKISHQRQYVDEGHHPLPIYTAVRHEIPIEEVAKGSSSAESIKDQAKKEAWFQWFEFTPYELFCEEIGAGIPTWSVGRGFRKGISQLRDNGLALPEIRTPLLMGIFGSAFCATLSHYYKEIRPLVKGLTGFGGLDELIQGKNEDLIKLHPIEPSQIPSFAVGMREQLPSTVPESIHTQKEISLMDAGMSNNLPIYPLLRPGRDVDIIVAFDASADIKKENWLRVVDGYAKQRGIRGWPLGTGWPDGVESGAEATGKGMAEADETTPQRAAANVKQAAKDQQAAQSKPKKSGDATEERKKPHHNEKDVDTTDLDYVNIWVGTTEQRSTTTEPPHSKRVEEDWELMTPDAGIAVIYLPFMPNPQVDGVDPQKTEFMSTWNFVYTPDNVDKVVELARANFELGQDRIKMAVRAVYERKKKLRLQREAEAGERGRQPRGLGTRG